MTLHAYRPKKKNLNTKTSTESEEKEEETDQNQLFSPVYMEKKQNGMDFS